MKTISTSRNRARLPLTVFSSILAACPAIALAQTGVPSSTPTFSFAVATIKPSDPIRPDDKASAGFNPSGSFEAKAQSLKELIEFVSDFGYYDVDQRIIGGPKWLGSAKFDISAKCDEEAARAFEKMRLRDQIRTEQSMMRALLADRFQLKTHHETRLLPVYALVLAKGISRMKPSANATPDDYSDTDGPIGNWKADGVTMQALADDLAALP